MFYKYGTYGILAISKRLSVVSILLSQEFDYEISSHNVQCPLRYRSHVDGERASIPSLKSLALHIQPI
jgi:hypothetical protein